MTSYSNSGLFAPGTMANNHIGNEWEFQGKTLLESDFEDNFEDDMNAIAEDTADDSAYYSNEIDSKSSFCDDTSYNDLSPSKVETKTAGSYQQQHFYSDAAASNRSNHGSIYDRTLNKSTTHLETATSVEKQHKETRMSKTVYHPIHEYEHKLLHTFSSLKYEVGDKRPIEAWETSDEPHERLAYRLGLSSNAGTTKRRKTGSKK